MARARLGSWDSLGCILGAGRTADSATPGAATRRKYMRKPGADASRRIRASVFEAIVYVLRTGCQWKALPAERFGSASAIHKRFLEWEKAGLFEALWKAGLAEYDDMEGIAWRWQSIDGAMMKAPLAQESVGPNPTDRGKKWKQANPAGGRAVASRCRSS